MSTNTGLDYIRNSLEVGHEVAHFQRHGEGAKVLTVTKVTRKKDGSILSFVTNDGNRWKMNGDLWGGSSGFFSRSHWVQFITDKKAFEETQERIKLERIKQREKEELEGWLRSVKLYDLSDEQRLIMVRIMREVKAEKASKAEQEKIAKDLSAKAYAHGLSDNDIGE